MSKHIILGITGASGAIYGLRLFDVLLSLDFEVHVILSNAGKKVLWMETGHKIVYFKRPGAHLYLENQIEALPASGSWPNSGMIVCPCSMATLGAIGNGIGDNLIHRAADVCLKERRKLILVIRETPLNIIHIENMLKVSRAGGVVFPACPGFYNNPQEISDLVNHVVCRILDQLGIKNNLCPRWEGPKNKDVKEV